MSRSKDTKLADAAIWNNNYWIRGRQPDKIFIHHMVAKGWTGKRCGEFFKGQGVSSNYGIGFKGDICQYVEEKYGAKAQGSLEYNKRGISIEMANSTGSPTWKVSDDSLEAVIELVADIIIRHKMGRAKYTGNLKGNICKHKWVAQTSCPGEYLGGKFKLIADEANKIIDGDLRLPVRGYYDRDDYGRSVRILQRFLRKEGVYKGPYKGTFGRYGSGTIKAVKKWQKKHGLTVDGLFGRECFNKYLDIKGVIKK